MRRSSSNKRCCTSETRILALISRALSKNLKGSQGQTVHVKAIVRNSSQLLALVVAGALSIVVLGLTCNRLQVCARNRRKEQNMVQRSIGFNWGPAATGLTDWTGFRLSVLLQYCGIKSLEVICSAMPPAASCIPAHSLIVTCKILYEMTS